jgi:Carboxypeptidase regulatory-like domain
MFSASFRKKYRALRHCLFAAVACFLASGVGLAAQWGPQPFSQLNAFSASARGIRLFPTEQQPAQQGSGTITGKVVDQSGTAVEGAAVKLTREEQPAAPDTVTDEEGQFYFTNVAAGRLKLSIIAVGFASQDLSVDLHAGQVYEISRLMLDIAVQVTEVRVTMTQTELADQQLKEQEKQRVFYLIPNFYVTYNPNAVPLNTRQKFRLAWKSSVDPFTLVGVGALAGVDQTTNRWGAYGQGFSGYAKRYGAGYGNVVIGTYLGGAVLPSILRQDPRYYYKGTGSKPSRLWYALSRSVICKGDNGHWQPNYSNIAGNFAAGAFAQLYYPPNDRNGANGALSIGLIRIAETALANVFQEFLVLKWTPSVDSSTLPSNLTDPSDAH